MWYTKAPFSEGDRFPFRATALFHTGGHGGWLPALASEAAQDRVYSLRGTVPRGQLSVPMADDEMAQLLRQVGVDDQVLDKFKQVGVRISRRPSMHNGRECLGQRRSPVSTSNAWCAGVRRRRPAPCTAPDPCAQFAIAIGTRPHAY